MRTCVRYLFFYDAFYCEGKILNQKLSISMLHFIVSENCYWFCIVWFFPIKTHRLVSASHGHKIISSVIMERYLNILEVPRQQQEETFDEEKIKFINSKISIWDFFGIPQATYLSYANEEKSRMFKEYYTKLVDKFCSQGKFFVWFFWLVWQIFWCVSQYLVWYFFGLFLRKSTSIYSNWQQYFSTYSKCKQNLRVEKYL